MCVSIINSQNRLLLASPPVTASCSPARRQARGRGAGQCKGLFSGPLTFVSLFKNTLKKTRAPVSLHKKETHNGPDFKKLSRFEGRRSRSAIVERLSFKLWEIEISSVLYVHILVSLGSWTDCAQKL